MSIPAPGERKLLSRGGCKGLSPFCIHHQPFRSHPANSIRAGGLVASILPTHIGGDNNIMERFTRLVCIVVATVPHSAVSFLAVPQTIIDLRFGTDFASSLHSSQGDSSSEEPGLILNGLDQEMNQVASTNSFAEIDFLALAKKRAQERPESRNALAGEDDWKELAKEKKSQFGEIDDWENAMKEAGNVDSQILMFTTPADEEGDDEPKLLLF
jgi:hypothetical protein